MYSPQIFENWQLKSGEGLSVSFIVLWLAGDLTGLLGAMMAGLLPTMIILAVYVSRGAALGLSRPAGVIADLVDGQYTACDVILLFQVYYYRRYRAKKSLSGDRTETEVTPLLPASPGTQPKPLLPPWAMYPLLLVFVLASGVLGWYLSPLENNDNVSIPEQPKGPNVELEWKSQTLGYASAVLYIGSRVPQIAHNT